jgi:hypothetical protein
MAEDNLQILVELVHASNQSVPDWSQCNRWGGIS